MAGGFGTPISSAEEAPMRTGHIQLQLQNGDIAVGTWWSGEGREVPRMLRRYVPAAFVLDAHQLADLFDKQAQLVIVRVGARTLAQVVTEGDVRVHVAHMATEATPKSRRVHRRRVSTGTQAKVEAA